MSKRFWVGLIAATSVASVCEFFFGYLLDDDGVGYEQEGIGIYILLEILTVLSYFIILPFVWRRRYSTKRKTDIEIVDGDETLKGSEGRESVSSVSSFGSLGELGAESAGKNDGDKTDEIALGVQSSAEYPGRRVRSGSVTSKDLDYVKGWGFWSTAGVSVAIFMGIHVVITALIEASSPTAEAGGLHALNPPQLTSSEVSRVMEVLWFVPLLVCMLLSMRQMPDAHSHTAFGLLSGFFSCLFPFILGRSFLFFLVWFKSDIAGWFQFVSEFGLYICYMVFAALILECFRVMSLVASNEENVELAMAHCFVFQVFDCCFLNFMFIKLSPLSSTFLMIVVIRGFAAVARGSGHFVHIGYKLQERCGVMPDILKRPVLTLYTDLRWAHQSLVAEIISMSSVLVAILLEFMTNQCDSETGLVSEDLGSKDVFPVLTHEFSCAQTISLIVSNFIVLVVMVVALVFSTSIWHHKFKAMEKVMKHTLDAHKHLSVLTESAQESNDSSVRSAIELVARPAHTKTLDRTLSSLHRREERVKKLLTIPTKPTRWTSFAGKTDDVPDISIGDSDIMTTERTNLKPTIAGSARPRVRKRRNTMHEAQAIASMASNRLKAMTHIRSDQTLWNLREAIDVHYGRHFFLYLVSTGYAVCYSMQTVVRVNEDLRDLSTQVTFSTSECSANITNFG